MPIRITKQRLEELRREITEKDRLILETLKRCRYLTGQQIYRLFFKEIAEQTKTSALTQTARCLNRLRDYGLLRHLERRIGGMRAGSGSFIWTLTQAGLRLLYLNSNKSPRKQLYEPAPHFLEHTLIIAEAYLQLNEICAKHSIALARVEFEPNCWRWYVLRGKKVVLKPDLYAVTQTNNYEDSWFIEIDCDTENIARVLDKCDRYLHYLSSGIEQKQNGVFPSVVWIVPSINRKNSLLRHISKTFPNGNIFLVILPDELESLITGGAEKYLKTNEKGGTDDDTKR